MPPDESMPADDATMMDHVALECMNAIEAKDKAAFRECFHVLVADILNNLSDEMEKPE
jgi:hypothetical protein